MKKLLLFLFSLSVITACNKAGHSRNDKTSSNSARMQEFYDKIMNAHNPEMADSFVTADFVDHQPFPGQAPGIAGLKESFKGLFAAYPNLKFETKYIKAWGDTVLAHFNLTGTQSGPFMGMPASNKDINVEGVDIVILKDGKATEHWGYIEELKMMDQIGMGASAQHPTDSVY
jgi:predicted ester cyclase